MKTITDDITIFTLLEKANVAGFDPSKPQVLHFTHEESWGLLIFNPSGELKGCRLFVIDLQDLSAEAEKLLIPELLGLDDKHGYDRLKNKALAIVEHILHEKKSGQLYFDGH